MEFLNRLAVAFPTLSEAAVHPHCPDERAELYTAVDPGSGEVEVLNFLNALVRLFKPSTVLETGTGHGFTAIAIADALQANGFGHLHTVEVDAATVKIAENNLCAYAPGLRPLVTFHTQDSLRFVSELEDTCFDFAFFDSLVAFRHLELEALMQRNLLGPGAVCCFHDTSRLRGRTMHDYNPEMIATLDKHSEGRQWLECEFSRGFRLLRV